MVPAILIDWRLHVERGPGWLIIQPQPPEDDAELAPDLIESIWKLADEHMIYRIVLELDFVRLLSSHHLGQLIVLQKRLREHEGCLRLCGLNENAEQSLRLCRLSSHFICYHDRSEAVYGHRPLQPR